MISDSSGDDLGGLDVAPEDLGAGEGDHALDAGPTGVVDADARHPHLQRQVHDLADLLGHDLAQGAAEDGEVLGEQADPAPADGAVAGDHAVAGDAPLVHAEGGRAGEWPACRSRRTSPGRAGRRSAPGGQLALVVLEPPPPASSRRAAACSLRVRASSTRSFMVLGCGATWPSLPHPRAVSGIVGGRAAPIMEASAGGWARRALLKFFSPLEVVANVPTTMARAAELAAAGEPEGATVVAEEQTEGRGRLGRVWVAPPGSSLLVFGGAAAPDRQGVGLADGGRRRGRPGRGGRRGRPGSRPGRAEVAQRPGAGWPQGGRAAGRGPPGRGPAGGRAAGHGVNVAQGAGDFPPEVAGRGDQRQPGRRRPGRPGRSAGRLGFGGSASRRAVRRPAGSRCWPPTGSAWSPSAARSGPTASAPPRWRAPPST